MREDEEKYRKELEKVERFSYLIWMYGCPAFCYICLLSAFVISPLSFIVGLVIPFISIGLLLYAFFHTGLKKNRLSYACWSTYDGVLRIMKATPYVFAHGLFALFMSSIYLITALGIPYINVLFILIVPSIAFWIVVVNYLYGNYKKAKREWYGVEKKYYKTFRDNIRYNLSKKFSRENISVQLNDTDDLKTGKNTYVFSSQGLKLTVHPFGENNYFITIGKITDSNRAFAQQLKQIVDESATYRGTKR